MLIFEFIKYVVSDQLSIASDQYEHLWRYSRLNHFLLPFFLFAVLSTPTTIAEPEFLLQVLEVALNEVNYVSLWLG